MRVYCESGLMLTRTLFQSYIVLSILCHEQSQICRELLSGNELDLPHTVLSSCVKSVPVWHFLEECFICGFSDMYLLQSWFFVLICCTCTVALCSHSFSNGVLQLFFSLNSQSRLYFLFHPHYWYFSWPFLYNCFPFVYTLCLNLHHFLLHVQNNLSVHTNCSSLSNI